jgi:CheY-like chemotaxis protein
MSVSLEAVAVDSLVKDTIEFVQPLATSHDVTLESSIARDANRYVHADRQRLRQVLMNLMSNAVKYNRAGGTASLTVERAGERWLRFSVTDTGHGIAPADLGRLFNPFDRLDAAASGIEGTGLGLALSRSLAENMGGRMTVTSALGVGSTFAVELPATDPVVIAEVMAEHDPVVDVRSYAGRKQVLYVEDLVANVRLVEEVLKRRPEVMLIAAMFGSMALELAREHRPDLILLDVHLPDMTGDEVLRRLRADDATRSIPVVVLSADATQRQQRELRAAGATDYLTKPVGVRQLLEAVDRLLEPTPG